MIGAFPLAEPLARCVAPSAPQSVRLDTARGAIPMPPAERLVCLALLLADPSEAVRKAARGAWEEVPSAVVASAVEDQRMPEAVLDLVAARGPGDPHVLLRVLAHPRVGRRTLERFVACDEEIVLEVMAQNQAVLGAFPDLARRLAANPALHPGERGRLTSIYGVPEAGVREESTGRAPPVEPGEAAQEDAAETQDGALPAQAPELPPDLPRTLLEDGPEPENEAEAKSLYQLVQSLSIAEKIKLANLGSKGARRLLARDANRVVQRAVLRSPKIREDEVVPIAQDRTVSEELLRIILGRKDWMKSYPLRLALVQNPKTAVPQALRLLETLQDRDLRALSKSRNVPSPVSGGALRVLARRGKV